MVKEMIKKIIILFGLIFSMAVSINTISANTTSVKVEIMSRDIEKHTINVKTDDHNADKFTLRKVSAAQMDVANKGSIVKVTYDDNFNISSLEKIKSKDCRNIDMWTEKDGFHPSFLFVFLMSLVWAYDIDVCKL